MPELIEITILYRLFQWPYILECLLKKKKIFRFTVLHFGLFRCFQEQEERMETNLISFLLHSFFLPTLVKGSKKKIWKRKNWTKLTNGNLSLFFLSMSIQQTADSRGLGIQSILSAYFLFFLLYWYPFLQAILGI